MKLLLRLLSAWAVVGLLPLTPAWAQNKGVGAWRPVKDEVGFFSAGAREQADQKIAEIKRTLNKDLYIEAIKPPPAPKGLDTKDGAAVDKFFDQFAETRFTDLRVNGVYVMIAEAEKLHKFRVQVGNNTRVEGYFTSANRDTLVAKIREKLKANDHDGALLMTANYVFDTMKANHPVAGRKTAAAPAVQPDDGARAGGFNWSPIITIVLVVLGVWLLFALIRGLMGAAGGGGAPGMGYGGGGGGFMTSFLGGLFGAAAGMWMYNSFFGHGTSSAFGAGDSGGSASPDSGPADTASSGAGGDFGKDDGGGDWGGGDAAGGDAGGGDWGGGGGDWGGGGGDWGGGGGGDW
jgi:hypothetical protein